MPYVKVVFGLAVEGPFDYRVSPQEFLRAQAGMRVLVEFGRKKTVGFIAGLARKSSVKKVKPVIKILDERPVLSGELLLLARRLSGHYCSSLGEAIEAMLPAKLRSFRASVNLPACSCKNPIKGDTEKILLHDLDGGLRRDYYLGKIGECLKQGRSAILILPDISLLHELQRLAREKLNIEPHVLYRNQKQELEEWLGVYGKSGQLVIGTRSAVFAPVLNLGLVVIDYEDDPVYKQEQVPHYHARSAALERCGIEGAGLILAGCSPSIDSYYLSEKGEFLYLPLTRADKGPLVKLVFAGKQIISRLLQDGISSALSSGKSALLFINRKGFASFALCNNCHKALVCQRCSSNLVYDYAGQRLYCRHCNFSIEPPKVCPFCSSGYVIYKGSGTQKVESEVSRLFPAAKVFRADSRAALDFDVPGIYVTTSLITKLTSQKFDLVGVLTIDNELNLPELRATEAVFNTILKLKCLAQSLLIIQTASSQNRAFQALLANDPPLFYRQELKDRQELGFPPYSRFAKIRVRGKDEERVRVCAKDLHERLNAKKHKDVKLRSLMKAAVYKLRGNFYWEIIVSSPKSQSLSCFIKRHLKEFKRSGIIVTVDVDPI